MVPDFSTGRESRFVPDNSSGGNPADIEVRAPAALKAFAPPGPGNFLFEEVAGDIERGVFSRSICTRFPPEPNGYLHLGHARAILANVGVARKFEGLFNFRLDDTNPVTESLEFELAIKRDLEWLTGLSVSDRTFHASGYFERLYSSAIKLIEIGLAYVDDVSPVDLRKNRGSYFETGRPTPCRDRDVEENLQIFESMRKGIYQPGEKVLRAKIDLSHPNMNMRDPIIYRIVNASHHRAGAWNIYPMYDFAHPLSDAFEGVTHSICGKEFENHRPLYNWFLEKLGVQEPPRQIEFAELKIPGVVLGKRYIKRLIEKGHVTGWDDPRLHTLRGLRRRGVPSEAIRDFCDNLGVSKAESRVDLAALDYATRQYLNRTAQRAMVVLKPLRVIIDNYPAGTEELLDAANNPEDKNSGRRKLLFGAEIYIDRDDFMEEPTADFYRLSPGREVRLRHGYRIRCVGFEKEAGSGDLTALHVVYDPSSLGLVRERGKKSATLHWVSVADAVPVEVRLFNELFSAEVDKITAAQKIESFLAADSIQTVRAMAEPSLAAVSPGQRFQFERVGYFCVDQDSESAGYPIFNRTVTIKDAFVRKITQASRE